MSSCQRQGFPAARRQGASPLASGTSSPHRASRALQRERKMPSVHRRCVRQPLTWVRGSANVSITNSENVYRQRTDSLEKYWLRRALLSRTIVTLVAGEKGLAVPVSLDTH